MKVNRLVVESEHPVAPADGPNARLRSIAMSILLVGVAIYVAARLIVAIAPVLITLGGVLAVSYVAWVIVQRRRW